MPLSISIQFLTGRAHMHPWQTHHNEGRVEWPPSQWRLLRALVAVAGRGLTTLPSPDEAPPPKRPPVVVVTGSGKPNEVGVPPEAKRKISFSRTKGTLSLKEPLTDQETAAWKAANPGEPFGSAIDRLCALAASPDRVAFADVDGDGIPLSSLRALLYALSPMPAIWLPKTAGGHTRQYFPIHEAGMVKNTGSAVFDTFATVRKDQPVLFHWPSVELTPESLAHLKLLLGRMTYFGRAESWCLAEAHTTGLEQVPGVTIAGNGQTHWRCVCIDDGDEPLGKEYRDYTLERRLAPSKDPGSEVAALFPKTKITAGGSRPQTEAEFRAVLKAEGAEVSLLRCLVRESGQDIKDGLERPIGTRWVHYAVPRAIYAVPRPCPRPTHRDREPVDLVVYALNTAAVHVPVLPSLTDTLLVADRFRSATLALCRVPGPVLSGHGADGVPCKGHDHAFWWPTDGDNDGFIDRVSVHAQGCFQPREVDALRRLSRLRQRGGRPDLLVTPMFVGRAADYAPWRDRGNGSKLFVSATPYFCPLHLSHGRSGRGSRRPISAVILEALRDQNIITDSNEVESIRELVFDFDPASLPIPTATGTTAKAIPPRQYFPVVSPPSDPIPLAVRGQDYPPAYPGVCWKDPDQGYPFGLSVGLFVSGGTRFVRSLSFCRNRRGRQAMGYGRMLCIRFRDARQPQPFALGSQCHFGLGQFVCSFGT
jgi:CRISPR-associated protein Csb2